MSGMAYSPDNFSRVIQSGQQGLEVGTCVGFVVSTRSTRRVQISRPINNFPLSYRDTQDAGLNVNSQAKPKPHEKKARLHEACGGLRPERQTPSVNIQSFRTVPFR